MNLTGAQRTYLRGLAMSLHPAVIIGKGGLTEAVLAELERALQRCELIKVRFTAHDRAARAALHDAVAAQCQAVLCGAVGATASFYRQHPDPECRKVALPS